MTEGNGNSDNLTSITPAQARANERKEAKVKFLESLRIDPNVSLACDNAVISRDTAYKWRGSDKQFAADWDTAIERTRDVARSSIYRRGILGWDEKVVSQGQLVYEYEPVVDEEGIQRLDERGKPLMYGGKPLLIRKYSDSLASLYAKANLPEYKDKPQININTQLEDLAEKAKQELLADLLNEDKKQANSTESQS